MSKYCEYIWYYCVIWQVIITGQLLSPSLCLSVSLSVSLSLSVCLSLSLSFSSCIAFSVFTHNTSIINYDRWHDYNKLSHKINNNYSTNQWYKLSHYLQNVNYADTHKPSIKNNTNTQSNDSYYHCSINIVWVYKANGLSCITVLHVLAIFVILISEPPLPCVISTICSLLLLLLFIITTLMLGHAWVSRCGF